MWIADDTITAAKLNRSLIVEEYFNHLGAADNFTETAVGGNGTANSDAANHEMDLSSGTALAGYAIFRTKKTFTPSTTPIIVNIIVTGLQDGTHVLEGDVRQTFLGLDSDFSAYQAARHQAKFYWSGNGTSTWQVATGNAANAQYTTISNLANGDLVTIVCTTSSVKYYVNGALAATHTTYPPSGAMYCGGSVVISNAATARLTSIDYLGVINTKT